MGINGYIFRATSLTTTFVAGINVQQRTIFTTFLPTTYPIYTLFNNNTSSFNTRSNNKISTQLINNNNNSKEWFNRNFQSRKFSTKSNSSTEKSTFQDIDDKKKLITKDLNNIQSNVVKEGLWKKAVDVCFHYYHGFKLFAYEIRLSSRYMVRATRGDVLSRRERRQLLRTSADILRMLPFLVFVIVPFMEFLLPFALKLFPGMLPSTFADKSKLENDRLKQLKVKIDMARFLQDTVEEMSKSISNSKVKDMKQLVDLITKIKQKNSLVSNDDILKFSNLFEDELTLDNLSREQLTAVCRVLNVSTIGTNSWLIFQLGLRLKKLHKDDLDIVREGINSLTVEELVTANHERGMRSVGLSLAKLRYQLEGWIELSVEKNVPVSMILLTRALFFSGSPLVSDNNSKNVLDSLGDKLVGEAEGMIAAEISNKQRLELVKREEQRIREEKEHIREEQKLDAEQKAAEAKTAVFQAAADVSQGNAAKTLELERIIATVVTSSKEVKIDNKNKEKLIDSNTVTSSAAKLPNIPNEQALFTTKDIKSIEDETIITSSSTDNTLLKEEEKIINDFVVEKINTIEGIIKDGDSNIEKKKENVGVEASLVDKKADELVTNDDRKLAQQILKKTVINKNDIDVILNFLASIMHDSSLRYQRSELDEVIEDNVEYSQEDNASSLSHKVVETKLNRMLRKYDHELRAVEIASNIDSNIQEPVALESLLENARERLEKNHIDKLEAVIKTLDLDNDGYVSADELISVFSLVDEADAHVTIGDLVNFVNLMKDNDKNSAGAPESMIMVKSTKLQEQENQLNEITDVNGNSTFNNDDKNV